MEGAIAGPRVGSGPSTRESGRITRWQARGMRSNTSFTVLGARPATPLTVCRIMDTDAKEQRRAVNRATYAVLCDAYSRLPRVTRERLRAEYMGERARSDVMTWARYLTVVLPRLPREAR
jgi:hypothetical protein